MSVYEFQAQTLQGKTVSLGEYQGKVLLIVNTASACGFTPQYAGLEDLHKQFAAQGFSVLAFPCNQFGQQEKGDATQIQQFCDLNFNISFPLFEKIDVKGANAHPLFRYLTKTKPGFLGTESIKWNFTKFLVNQQGQVVKRYGSVTKPEAIAADIKALLG